MIDPTCSAESDLQELAEKEGWVSKEDQYFLHNQEEHVKPKKIISRIEFDSELMECKPTNIPIICTYNTTNTHVHTLIISQHFLIPNNNNYTTYLHNT